MARRHNRTRVSQRLGGNGRLGFTGRPNIFVEAVGSEVWGAQLRYLRSAGRNLIGSDSSPWAWGLYQMDGRFLLPEFPVHDYVSRAIEICRANGVNLVIP